MTAEPTTPTAWANLLVTAWGPRFPVDVRQIAFEYSKRFEDPILKIAEADISTFEGALFPFRKKRGWAIFYNPTISSPGRINYTLGHEWGHYLCHRAKVPAGFECGTTDVLGGNRDQEREADRFASYLLMPLNDFRVQVGKQPMTLALLRHCADRYGVSLTAAALKWLESTSQCAAVVVATNGYVLWFRRSAGAEAARLFFSPGMELPTESLAARGASMAASEGETLPPGVWADRPVQEVVIFADKYEMTISLLVFEDGAAMPSDWDENEVEDTFDRLNRRI